MPFCFECLTEKLFNRYPSCQSMPFVMLQQAAQTLQTVLHLSKETSTGNYCLTCFRAYIGHLHFSTSDLLYSCKIVLCWSTPSYFSPKVTVIWLILFNDFSKASKYCLVFDISLISGALLVSYLYHVLIISLFNDDLLLRSSMCLMYIFFDIMKTLCSRDRKEWWKNYTKADFFLI